MPSLCNVLESLPDALRQAKSSMFSEQVDVARKLHEDPLMAIRQRAVEKAKQLYNNPVKMKQIQKMVSRLLLRQDVATGSPSIRLVIFYFISHFRQLPNHWKIKSMERKKRRKRRAKSLIRRMMTKCLMLY